LLLRYNLYILYILWVSDSREQDDGHTSGSVTSPVSLKVLWRQLLRVSQPREAKGRHTQAQEYEELPDEQEEVIDKVMYAAAAQTSMESIFRGESAQHVSSMASIFGDDSEDEAPARAEHVSWTASIICDDSEDETDHGAETGPIVNP